MEPSSWNKLSGVAEYSYDITLCSGTCFTAFTARSLRNITSLSIEITLSLTFTLHCISLVLLRGNVAYKLLWGYSLSSSIKSFCYKCVHPLCGLIQSIDHTSCYIFRGSSTYGKLTRFPWPEISSYSKGLV